MDAHYRWNLITKDPDDNKFVDCAIFANADFIVSDDKHFNELGSVEFPKVLVVRLDDFARLFRKALNLSPYLPLHTTARRCCRDFSTACCVRHSRILSGLSLTTVLPTTRTRCWRASRSVAATLSP